MKYSKEALKQIMKEHGVSYLTLSRITGIPMLTIGQYISGRKYFSPIRLDGMLIDRAIDVIVENDIYRPSEFKPGSHTKENSLILEEWCDSIRDIVNPEEVKKVNKACREIAAIINESQRKTSSKLEYSIANYYADSDDDKLLKKFSRENEYV